MLPIQKQADGVYHVLGVSQSAHVARCLACSQKASRVVLLACLAYKTDIHVLVVVYNYSTNELLANLFQL